MEQNHHAHPELWFRPSPALSSAVLSEFFGREERIATPRLGRRDGTHPKGYIPGTIATLRLFDEARQEQLHKQARIVSIVSKPLHDFAVSELEDMHYPSDVESLRQDLSFFEGRPVTGGEIVTIVVCSYLKKEE